VDGIKANKDTVLTGTYPIARPLFMYTNGKPQGSAKNFIDFIMSPAGQKLVEDEGFVALKETAANSKSASLRGATEGATKQSLLA